MKRSQFVSFIVLCVAFISVLTGCKDEPLDLSFFVLPESEKFEGNDTALSVSAFSKPSNKISAFSKVFKWDETRLSEISYASPASIPLGEFSDPVFGDTKVGVIWNCFTRYRSGLKYLYSDYFNIRTTLVLNFDGTSYLGDTLSNNFKVYQYNKEFPEYTDSSDFSIDLGDFALLPINTGEVDTNYNSDGSIKSLELPLMLSYTSYVLSLLTITNDTTINYDDVYETPFKVYIEPEKNNAKGGIHSYRTGYKASTLTDYQFLSYIVLQADYNDTTESSTGADSAFVNTTELVRFTPFDHFITVNHKHSNTIENSFYDTVSNLPYTYVQALAGTQVQLNIDDLISYTDLINNSGVLVNRAELILPIASEYNNPDDGFTRPERIGIKVYNNSDTLEAVVDDRVTNVLTEGTYDEGLNAYVVNLTGHILETYLFPSSKVYKDYFTPTFEIFSSGVNGAASYELYTPSRVVLNSGTGENPMRLRFIYTVKPSI